MEDFLDLVSGGFQHALRRFLGPALGEVSGQLAQPLGLGDVREIDPIDRLGEPEVGVDAGHDYAGVDGQHFDADQ